MFCPNCRDEFRSGFTRCANCDVALVDDLSKASQTPPAAPQATTVAPQMAEYCGFLDLDDARQSREQLRSEGIRSDILIREIHGDTQTAPLEEEYWLRVEVPQFRRAGALLGYAESAIEEDQTLCDACGASTAAAESFCPNCGRTFEGR